jgi:hypothetical protein
MRGHGAALAVFAVLMVPVAHAGPWLRPPGHFYLNTGYATISRNRFFAPDFSIVDIDPYAQHLLTMYGEVGIFPWLMGSVEGVPLRYNSFKGQGATLGGGDWRVGLWTKIPIPKLQLALATLVGLPTGDAKPSAGRRASPAANALAASLPTGDGEADVEFRLSLGHTFGGVRLWPLRHYVLLEAGYWLHTEFHDAFTWRAELGTQFPWKIIDRFWFIVRLFGVESFASNRETPFNVTGLGDGVTFVSPGGSLFAQIYRGFGASIGFDSAIRARSVLAAAQIFVTLSYER